MSESVDATLHIQHFLSATFSSPPSSLASFFYGALCIFFDLFSSFNRKNLNKLLSCLYCLLRRRVQKSPGSGRNEGHRLEDVRVIRRYHISTPVEKIPFPHLAHLFIYFLPTSVCSWSVVANMFLITMDVFHPAI